MDTRLGKGDLCGITVIEESAYGTTGTTKAHMGVMQGLTIDDGIETEEMANCGDRRKGSVFVVKKDFSANVDFKVGKDVSLMGWLGWAIGTHTVGEGDASHLETSLSCDPPSKTVYFKVATSSTDVMTGAAINKLTIASSEPGKPLSFSAEMYAKTLAHGSNVTGSAISSQTPTRTSSFWVCSDNRLGTVKSGEWTLTILQNLSKNAGASSDADPITIASGESPSLGVPEVTLEIVRPAKDRSLDTMRAEFTTGMTFSLTVNGVSITLSGCDIVPGSTKRSTDPYTETITVKAKDIVCKAI